MLVILDHAPALPPLLTTHPPPPPPLPRLILEKLNSTLPRTLLSYSDAPGSGSSFTSTLLSYLSTVSPTQRNCLPYIQRSSLIPPQSALRSGGGRGRPGGPPQLSSPSFDSPASRSGSFPRDRQTAPSLPLSSSSARNTLLLLSIELRAFPEWPACSFLHQSISTSAQVAGRSSITRISLLHSSLPQLGIALFSGSSPRISLLPPSIEHPKIS